MRFSLCTTREWRWAALAGLALCAMSVWAQDQPPQALGDVARKARKEHAGADRASAAHIANEDQDGPDSGGVWHVRLCVQAPCYDISVTLPKTQKWTRLAREPRPVMIALPGPDENPDRAIRVYAAEALPSSYILDAGTRTLLQAWFARPEYFGHSARIVLKQNVVMDGRSATIAHFTVAGSGTKYRGVSVVATTQYGDFGFACVFREEDAGVAASVCDAIVSSAKTQTLQPPARQIYPTYWTPPPQYYPRRTDDPPADPPYEYEQD
jgi:hypothetical protein